MLKGTEERMGDIIKGAKRELLAGEEKKRP